MHGDARYLLIDDEAVVLQRDADRHLVLVGGERLYGEQVQVRLLDVLRRATTQQVLGEFQSLFLGERLHFIFRFKRILINRFKRSRRLVDML